MAGAKGSKYYNIFLKQQLQLVTIGKKVIINDEGLSLLNEVRKEQSIVAASKNMGISYRKAWGLLRETEKLIGFQLVGKHRGGKDGGKTYLTPDGNDLVDAYDLLLTELEKSSHDPVKKFFRSINEISDRK
jgi:molybdate transport system regulatory protein